MRKFSYLMLGLLVSFVVLYWFDPVILERNLKDLWANLLASVIAVLLIDKVIELSKRERQEKSRDYVKSKLYGTCTFLMYGFSPMVSRFDWGYFTWSWEEYIKRDYNGEDWAWYFEHVIKSRDRALKELRYIAEYQLAPLEEELRGDLMTLLHSLENRDWNIWIQTEKKQVWKLMNMAELAAKSSEISFKLLKEYNLLAYEPKFSQEDFSKHKIDKQALKRVEDVLSQTLRFKDAILSKLNLTKLRDGSEKN
jgi:hypothetical protein